MVGVVNGEVIIYRPLCGGCAVRGAEMGVWCIVYGVWGAVWGENVRAKARGMGLYGDLAGGERRGVWRGDMRAIARREGEGQT